MRISECLLCDSKGFTIKKSLLGFCNKQERCNCCDGRGHVGCLGDYNVWWMLYGRYEKQSFLDAETFFRR